MRILFISERSSPNGYYRAVGPITALAQRGHEALQLRQDDRIDSRELSKFDLLHVHRYCDPPFQKLASSAGAAGLAVTWDNDDDYGGFTKEMPEYRVHGGFNWERHLVALKRMLALTTLVTTTNETLAGRLRGIGAREVRVIENHVPQQFLVERARRSAGVTVGWVAAMEHRVDIAGGEVQAALARLLDEHSNLHVESIGVDLQLDSDRYRHRQFVPFNELTETMSGFDVGIAPLIDHPFNRTRSNVKLKEYAAAGVPWLASGIGPYVGLGEREGGRLVQPGGWHAAIARLVERERERRKLAKRARAWVEKQTIERNADRWESAFETAIAMAATSPR